MKTKFVFLFALLSLASCTPPSRVHHPDTDNQNVWVGMAPMPPLPIASSSASSMPATNPSAPTCEKKCQQLIRISKRAADQAYDAAAEVASDATDQALDAIEKWQMEQKENK